MAKMRAVQVTEANGPFELVEREIPIPGSGEVRVRVQACGLCHSDAFTKEGTFPGINYPRVPGHEIAGFIDAVGDGVSTWKTGDRVGIGWYGGHCGHCPSCRGGDFINCLVAPQVPGITYDGGYADYVVVPAEAPAHIPEELPPVEAAPLMCAGITTYNALRNSGARAGDLVVVLGIGGLGHLGVQFAVKMGFRTVAVARGKEKEPLALQLGAHHYLDSQAVNVAEELTKLGGAKAIIATVTSGQAMSAVVGGLGVDGKLMVIGAASDPIQVDTVSMIMGRRTIQGWPSGTARDSEDTLAFGVLAGVRPMIEVFPLEKAAEAYERMMSGRARFRVVLKMEET